MARSDWSWQDWASCRGEDLVLFFGPAGEGHREKIMREEKATRVCRSCPVRAACLDHALTAPERLGVWGGLGEDQRASERRRRQRRAYYQTRPEPAPDADEKQCVMCDEVLPADTFGKNKRTSDGLNAACRPCTNEAARQRREAEEAVA